ncbi:MAG TPA: hypothetical protein PKE37_16975 [Thiomonas arsenitoxydans]|jgi:hypothetical protein|uniref:hypothetical protein n=1 Tax=Thiomonas arsenitoxydans (strain DSM 22701 / CIP 110005 / 3As) TaxID=426114 RepID=UPI000BCCB362|nr:hypothetical protein [Thiomonas arsenitoxydans]OZB55738.1 MAG: hypothetical protein B7X43_00055 [Thiomonas sp. 15-63-373]HML83446.1 hypothetical protein [Thiomonas arsenitoxydans]
MKINDAVCIAGDVIRRCGHSEQLARKRGHVVNIEGRVAEVAWDDEQRTRLIPLASLAVISKAQGIIEPRAKP